MAQIPNTPPTTDDSQWVVLAKIWNAINSQGGGGGGPVTIADGADVTQGAIADAAAAAGAAGTVQAHLRAISRDLVANIVLAAGANLIGRVSASNETSTIYSGTTALTPQYALISAALSGDNTLVAAGTNKIRVLQACLISSGTVSVRFESGAGGTALTGVMPLTAQVGFNTGYCPVGHFQTGSATLLNLELSGAVGVFGWLVYVDAP